MKTAIPTKTRIKQPAQINVPKTMDECAADINLIGRKTRYAQTIMAAMNDEIADVTDRHTQALEAVKGEIKNLTIGVQSYCEANRSVLTNDGKSKSGHFITGDVQWRQKPPSVMVRGVEAVIEALKQFGLDRFVRVKEELNKEAILNEPAVVNGIAGLSIKSGVEDFVITPFEQE